MRRCAGESGGLRQTLTSFFVSVTPPRRLAGLEPVFGVTCQSLIKIWIAERAEKT